MKKIVSAVVISALTLCSVFADMSFGYTSKGTVIDWTKTSGVKDTDDVTSATVLDQSGYSNATSDFEFSISNDLGGIVVDIDPDATAGEITTDAIYGWGAFGNLVFTTGKFEARYVNRVNADKGDWESVDYERYKPGIISGRYGDDVDNITKIDGVQRLAFAAAYTLKDVLPGTLMFKGVLTDHTFGGENSYGEKKSWGNLNEWSTLYASPAAEIAYRQDDVIDFNVVFKSVEKSGWTAGAFVRPLMVKGLNLLVGFTYEANSVKDEANADYGYSAFGIDLRARYAVNDNLAITTMHNVTRIGQKLDSDNEYSMLGMWNMISAAYKVTEKLTAQLTVENECALSASVKAAGTSLDTKTADMGGYNISVIPGVVYQLAEGAKLTAGVRVNLQNVGASSDYTDFNGSVTNIAVPVVFSVQL